MQHLFPQVRFHGNCEGDPLSPPGGGGNPRGAPLDPLTVQMYSDQPLCPARARRGARGGGYSPFFINLVARMGLYPYFFTGFSSAGINIHSLTHSRFSGRYFLSAPGFITALCFAPQTRHSISPVDSSTTFITCSFLVMLPVSICCGDKTTE